MMPKTSEKEKAIKFRKRGFSYSEILKKVPVAKSTLSLWLRDVGLAKRQRQRLADKKIAAALKGAEARRNQRLAITKEIKGKAQKEIGKLSDRELWLIGISLYWAEGHKEKNKGNLVKLGNSDPRMIRLFLKWLYRICGVRRKDLVFRIYLHKTSKNRLRVVKRYWAKNTGLSEEYFQKITWKKNKINTNRKNIGKDYYGLLDVGVRKSINLNRKIQGWTDGICNYCGVVQR